MKCAVIDIGSNSMRLTVYDAGKDRFTILFKERLMTGLAGYVKNGFLSAEGVRRACEGLSELMSLLRLLKIGRNFTFIFARASLRNIRNSSAALDEICAAVGADIEIISGKDEALFGYTGAMCDLKIKSGIFADIGGASTEIAIFSDGEMKKAESYPIGSLKLYRDCVKELLPEKSSLERLKEKTKQNLREISGSFSGESLVCVGGTAKTALKICGDIYKLPQGSRTISARQLESLCDTLFRCDKNACDIILKNEPERIHTIIPGLVILKNIADKFGVSEIFISKYGVREGYLCKRIQKNL